MSAKTERFSTSWPKEELPILNNFSKRKGISRNELVRRATLAYILCENHDFNTNVAKAYEDIGKADSVTSLFGEEVETSTEHYEDDDYQEAEVIL